MGIVQEDMIFALATPWGQSPLAIIRTSGKGVIEACARLMVNPEPLVSAQGHSLVYANVREPESGQALDEVLFSVFRSPRSYTAEDMVEISCHGSQAGIERLFSSLLGLGMRQAEPGEFTRRAFVNGKLDLTKAEAIHDIIQADTTQAHKLAMARLNGSIETSVEGIKQSLLTVMAQVSVQLDYAEDEIETIDLDMDLVASCAKTMEGLIRSYDRGRLYQEGLKVILAGATNAGKSSLFNGFLREERAIVSPIHGTTRDYISTSIQFRGIPVHLHDTAGLRVAGEAIEEEGIRRSQRLLEEADWILYLIDGQDPQWEKELEQYRNLVDRNRPVLLVQTKSDLGTPLWHHEAAIALSSLSGDGMELLEDQLFASIQNLGGVEEGAPVLASLRQKKLIESALGYLRSFEAQMDRGDILDGAAMDLHEVLHCLGQISGEVSSEDILDAMFSGFCLGK